MTNTYEAAMRYLSNQGVTLWADWDISSPPRLKLAAEWLAEQVEAVNETTLDIRVERSTAPSRHIEETEPEGASPLHPKVEKFLARERLGYAIG